MLSPGDDLDLSSRSDLELGLDGGLGDPLDLGLGEILGVCDDLRSGHVLRLRQDLRSRLYDWWDD